MSAKLAILAICLAITGCANFRGQRSTSWPWPDQSVCGTDGTCTPAHALDAYMRATRFCRQVANYYESGGRNSDLSQFAVGAVGTLAGTVLAPIAQGTAATAWSGLSGAANALQMSMEQTFSATLAINRQSAVAKAAAEGSKTFAGATDASSKVIAAVDMARNCSLAPAAADKEALQSLAK